MVAAAVADLTGRVRGASRGSRCERPGWSHKGTLARAPGGAALDRGCSPSGSGKGRVRIAGVEVAVPETLDQDLSRAGGGEEVEHRTGAAGRPWSGLFLSFLVWFGLVCWVFFLGLSQDEAGLQARLRKLRWRNDRLGNRRMGQVSGLYDLHLRPQEQAVHSRRWVGA